MGSSSSKSSSSGHVRFERIEDNLTIKEVWIGLRQLVPWYASGVNHWSVIMKLDNGRYVCLQKHDSGKIGCETAGSLRSASLMTWGGEEYNKVRLSCYGTCNEAWSTFKKYYLPQYDEYTLIFDDCQTFARHKVEYLTGKTVGIWPIEDGPTYYY